MSMRVYLDEKKMKEAGMIYEKRRYGNDVFEAPYFEGMRFDRPDGDGRIVFLPGGLLAGIPEKLQRFVVGASYYENFGIDLIPRRRLGRYHLESATAELEAYGNGKGSHHYHVRLQAENPSDLIELYTLIREGQIWPEIDYEAVQVIPPFKDLRNLMKDVRQLVRRYIYEKMSRIRLRILG